MFLVKDSSLTEFWYLRKIYMSAMHFLVLQPVDSRNLIFQDLSQRGSSFISFLARYSSNSFSFYNS